jgi:hypothetical protein
MIEQLSWCLGVVKYREMVIAERKTIRFKVVERVVELVDLRGGRVLCRDELVLLARQHRLGVGLRQKGE